MIKKIKNIVILGGGTSAWMSAAYLLNNIPNINITVIDKEVGTPVGVGEGTLLNFEPFMNSCGFNIDDWFSQIDATYKSGILFPNWKKKGEVIWHPFKMNVNVVEDISVFDLWSQSQQHDFKKYGLPMYDISINHNSIDRNEKYGYHVDCSKLVQYIKGKLQNKIEFISSEMVSQTYCENGNLEKVLLKNQQEIHGDLFIDCTGFAHLLNKNPKRVNLNGRLFCNTAIAGHIPYIDRKTELRPYVISDAVDIGWVWNIPVRTRIGSGLVFNRSITDPEDAKDYFVKYWDNRIDKKDLKLIDWTPFYNEDFWHENVVAIGLSAGFIEPLESTGIALIMEGIYQLAARIIDNNFNELDVNLYNQNMKCFFEESIDFVNMHYSVNERDEPFWQFVKENHKLSDKQQFFINEFASKDEAHVPNKGTNTNFFCGENWTLWLIQLGIKLSPRKTILSDKQAEEILLDHYKRNEMSRHIWAGDHCLEIERLEVYYNTK